MTLTAAQAEIVRRFVAGETLHGFLACGGFALGNADAALRAALISKDAEIERLGKERDTAYAQGARDATNVEGK